MFSIKLRHCLYFLLIVANTSLADFSPQQPDFPHGKGILRLEGKCAAGMDNKCYSGTDFPSFNNYIDSTIKSNFYKGIGDERRFLVLANVGFNGANPASYSNTIKVNKGDIILTRIFVHNNGRDNREETTAKNVKVGINGFLNAGAGYFYSNAGKEIVIEQFVSSSNSIPDYISDDARVISASGERVKLMFFDTNGAIQSTVHPKQINQHNFFAGGANIGEVRGEAPFYLYVYMRVISADDTNLSKISPASVTRVQE